MSTLSHTANKKNQQAFDHITRAITDNATNALFLMDARGICTFLNPAAEAMFGYTLEEMQDKSLHDIVHYKHPDGTPFPMHECHIGRSVFSLQNLKSHEDTFVRKDGTFVAVKCSAKPLTVNNDLTGILLEVQDITEEKKAAQAIKDSEERYRTIAANLEQIVAERTRELQRSNEDLLQFAHVASHDLKEPVRKILFFTNRVQNSGAERLTEEEKTHLAKIVNAGERLRTMIDGVLKYSSANHTNENTLSVNLNTIIGDVINDLEVVIQLKGAAIAYKDLPEVEGSPVLLYQLFYNLMNNALKFCHQDKAPAIGVTATLSEAYAQITVRDNGIGFDPRFAERIFDPFIRLNSKDEFEGTGLGLALCKKIVHRHRGTISAANNEEGGTCITISLPLIQETGSI